MGVDESAITRAEALLSLPEDIQLLVAEGAVPASSAYYISRLPGEQAQCKLARAVAAGKLSRADVIEAVHAAIGMKRIPAHVSRLICRDGGVSVTVKADRALDWDRLLAALDRIKEKAVRLRDGRKEVEDLGHPRRRRAVSAGRRTAKPVASSRKPGVRRVMDDLPARRRHWVPVSRSRGCMAVNLDTTPQFKDMLLAACERLLAQTGKAWHLPADREHRQTAAIYRTAEVMGIYRSGGHPPRIHFDPRMAPFIREEMGLPAALPRHRRHWIPTTTEGCGRMRIERRWQSSVALKRLCARLLASDDAAWELPKGRDESEPPGVYRPADVIAIYTNIGKSPVYYFDPRLQDAGIITRQAVKELAARLTPEDLTADDPALLAERAKLIPPARQAAPQATAGGIRSV